MFFRLKTRLFDRPEILPFNFFLLLRLIKVLCLLPHGRRLQKMRKLGMEQTKQQQQQQQRRKSDRDAFNAKTIAKIRFLLKYYFLFASFFVAWIKRWTTTEINEWIDATERLILMIKLVKGIELIHASLQLSIWVFELSVKKKKWKVNWFSHRKEKNCFPKLRNTSTLTKTLHTLWYPLSLSLVYSWWGQQPSLP